MATIITPRAGESRTRTAAKRIWTGERRSFLLFPQPPSPNYKLLGVAPKPFVEVSGYLACVRPMGESHVGWKKGDANPFAPGLVPFDRRLRYKANPRALQVGELPREARIILV